jgi:hypothetical protein
VTLLVSSSLYIIEKRKKENVLCVWGVCVCGVCVCVVCVCFIFYSVRRGWCVYLQNDRIIHIIVHTIAVNSHILIMIRAFTLSALAAVAMGATCPTSDSSVHAGCQEEIVFSNSCDEVRQEISGRIAGQYNQWHDPHNNGTYTMYVRDC